MVIVGRFYLLGIRVFILEVVGRYGIAKGRFRKFLVVRWGGREEVSLIVCFRVIRAFG